MWILCCNTLNNFVLVTPHICSLKLCAPFKMIDFSSETYNCCDFVEKKKVMFPLLFFSLLQWRSVLFVVSFVTLYISISVYRCTHVCSNSGCLAVRLVQPMVSTCWRWAATSDSEKWSQCGSTKNLHILKLLHGADFKSPGNTIDIFIKVFMFTTEFNMFTVIVWLLIS